MRIVRMSPFQLFMNREEIIHKLNSLTDTYQDEEHELEIMNILWEEHGDPASDPGMQFEQSNKIDKAWDNLREFIKTII